MITDVCYDAVQVGDTISDLSKGVSAIIKIEDWWTRSEQHCYRVTLENGGIYYGWNDRTLKKHTHGN